MQNIKYAFKFIGRSFQIAKENEPLQKPWMILSLGALGIWSVYSIFFALVLGFLGDQPFALIMIGLLVVLALFSLTVWGEISASQTCQIFGSLIHESEPAEETLTGTPFSLACWGDVFLLTLTLPGKRLKYGIRSQFGKPAAHDFDGMGSLDLLLPVIALENYSLAIAVDWVRQVARDNLLRLQPQFIRVGLVARIVQWLFQGIGIIIGVIVGNRLVSPLNAGRWQLILGSVVGLLIMISFATLGISFSSFTRACYHTTLYRWVKRAEKARQTGDAGWAKPPEILERVLDRQNTSNKER